MRWGFFLPFLPTTNLYHEDLREKLLTTEEASTTAKNLRSSHKSFLICSSSPLISPLPYFVSDLHGRNADPGYVSLAENQQQRNGTMNHQLSFNFLQGFEKSPFVPLSEPHSKFVKGIERFHDWRFQRNLGHQAEGNKINHEPATNNSSEQHPEVRFWRFQSILGFHSFFRFLISEHSRLICDEEHLKRTAAIKWN